MLPQWVPASMLYVMAASWTAVYVLVIVQTHRDKIIGIPVPALVGNLAWEFLCSFITPWQSAMRPISMCWCALDIVILIQALRYGPTQYNMNKLKFAGQVAFGLAAAGIIMLAIHLQLDRGKSYTSYGNNVLMSILFLYYVSRFGSGGQSLLIASLKMLGSAIVGIRLYIELGYLEICVVLTLVSAFYDGWYWIRLWRELQLNRTRRMLPQVAS